MPGARISAEELESILQKPGYRISGGIPKGVPNAIGKGAIAPAFSHTRQVCDVERNFGDEQVGPKGLQIQSTGKVLVRIKFYRHRLADYSRAISEKAYIDFLQYCGALTGDSEREIRLQDDGQEKVARKEDERTEIIIEYPEVDFDNLFSSREREDGR